MFINEVLPGDTHTLSMAMFARMQTPLYPVMDNQYLEVHFFFCPNRILWDDWNKFCGEQINPGDSTEFSLPVTSGSWALGSVADYFGIPPSVPNPDTNALPFRAYNMIYNEWFRSQDLSPPCLVPKGPGPDPTGYYDLVKRQKKHDYFTSCLPWAQKGTPVSIPLGQVAPVVPTGANVAPRFKVTGESNMALIAGGATNNAAWSVAPNDPSETADWDITGLQADLTSATLITINDLREGAAMQRLLERDARGGTRYAEILRSHFGVTSPDARLQRPEFLGGGRMRILTTPVPQTAQDMGGGPVGKLGGFTTAATAGVGFNKSFTEHGWIIGLVSSRADLNYFQGIPRMFSRSSRWDHYWPELSNLGEQAVKNKEIFADGSAADELTFGYQERWSEYRTKPNLVTNQMRPDISGGFGAWHLAEEFDDLPQLGDTFIQQLTPMDRILAITSQPHFFFDANFKYTCARPMPTYSVPGYTNRF